MTQPTLAAVAMTSAVDQARKDRWLAKFKPIESPHGNYILPVVPCRVDFGKLEECFQSWSLTIQTPRVYRRIKPKKIDNDIEADDGVDSSH